MLVEENSAPQAHVAVGRRGAPVDEGDCEVGVVVGGGQRTVERARDLHGNGVDAGGGNWSDIDGE